MLVLFSIYMPPGFADQRTSHSPYTHDFKGTKFLIILLMLMVYISKLKIGICLYITIVYIRNSGFETCNFAIQLVKKLYTLLCKSSNKMSAFVKVALA